MCTHLDPVRAAALLERQAALQAEAQHVIAELDLRSVLGCVGHVRLVGSAVTGLMVWRDLDVQVLAPSLSAGSAWAAIAPLAAHPRTHEVRYINQSDNRSCSGDPRDDRFYFQLFYHTSNDDIWKLDISFWLVDDEREDEVTYQADLVRRLDPDTRLAILWIKSLWVESPHRRDVAYGRDVSSIDLYDAVLEHAVRTPETFDAYLAARGKPTRSLDRSDAA